MFDREIMDKKLVDDLKSGKVEEVSHLILPFISSSLNLVPKDDKD